MQSLTRIATGKRVTHRICTVIGIVVLCGPLAPLTLAQDDESEDDFKGVYERMDLIGSEQNDLIDTSAQYKGMFERRLLLYNDPQVLALVRRIGNELAPAPTDDYIHYEFYVIRDPSPNAFAFPNGQIYVHSGMLARMADESQLAALLAHEINHVAGHHAILSHRFTAKRVFIGVFGGGLGSIMGQLRYSRKLEQEADDRAPLLMQDTPYDAHGMTELLEILNEDFEGLDARLATMWTTHPDPEERIEASRQNVASYPYKERHPAEFDSVAYSLRALTVEDYIQDDYPYTAIAVSKALLERYPNDLDFKMAIGDAERALGPRPPALPEEFSNRDKFKNVRDRLRNSRKQRMDELLATPEGVAAKAVNLERARQTYESILAADPNYVAAHRGLGEVYEAQGNDREAARSYLAYLRGTLDAPDRALIMGRLTAIRDRLLEEESTSDENQ